MAEIQAVGTAVPEHILDQQEVRRRARRHFAGALRELDRLLAIFVHTGIEQRHVCMPLEWYETAHPFAERNRLYVEHATALGTLAARRCLERAGCRPADVDAVFFVSSTGLATPSLDVRLAEQLGLAPHIQRTPIWGLGCAGGAAGLARAYHYACANPDRRAMVVAVELCSLTFHPEDRSKRNLIAAALFADGAAAALVAGERVGPGGRPGPEILAAASHLWPDTRDLMGWDVTPRGLEVVFSRRIPHFVRREVRGAADTFLAERGLTLKDVGRLVLHPGGTRVLDAYATAWERDPADLEPAREVMRQFGNMSSPTVLFVLEGVLADSPAPGTYGLLGALGPGFTSEQVLLRW